MASKRTKIRQILENGEIESKAMVKGWVRTFRSNRFIHINDGSTINNLQAVIDFENFDEAEIKRITTGASIVITGKLAESMGKGQRVELLVETFEILGDSNPDEYPLQPKKHSMEFLRSIAHLRPRTNTFGAVLRIRHALSFAVHKYFNDNGFYNIWFLSLLIKIPLSRMCLMSCALFSETPINFPYPRFSSCSFS